MMKFLSFGCNGDLLMISVQRKQLKFAKLVLHQQGMQDSEGNTALMFAARYGLEDIFDELK